MRLTHVVALTRDQLLSLKVEGREGAARGKEALALGVLDRVLESALRLGAGVGQGEDDGPLVHGSHLLEDLGGESTADGAQTHKDGGLDVVDDLLEGLVLLAVVVVAREVALVVGEFALSVVGNHALGVDEPEAFAGLVFGKPLVDEESGKLLCNTNTSTTCAQKYSPLEWH